LQKGRRLGFAVGGNERGRQAACAFGFSIGGVAAGGERRLRVSKFALQSGGVTPTKSLKEGR
jgi:hypothetical protein